MSRSKIGLSIFGAAILSVVASNEAAAILVRADYDAVYNPGSALAANFSRYINLAQQDRLYTVVGIERGNNAPSCTGTLISTSIILTAAHCFSDPTLFSSSSTNGDWIESTFATQVSFAAGSAIVVPSLPSYPADLVTTPTITYSGVADRVAVLRETPKNPPFGAAAIG